MLLHKVTPFCFIRCKETGFFLEIVDPVPANLLGLVSRATFFSVTTILFWLTAEKTEEQIAEYQHGLLLLHKYAPYETW